jgi:phospholipid-binding lipoprotein MlaA
MRTRFGSAFETITANRLFHVAAVIAVLGLLLSGCATPGRTTGDDPWAGMNRGIDKFNDGLDRAIVKPTAKGYKKVTPEWFRGMTGRFFSNLGYPFTMVNQLLQGKPKLFLLDTGRFITNSTLGLAGLFDVADHMGMPAHEEDFGQTLAVWGVPSGPYLTLPLLGPSTLRDAPAQIPEYLYGFLGYGHIATPIKLGIRGLDIVDTRASLLSADATLESAYDRYGVMRDAWIQRRQYLIFDGNPPEEKIEEPVDDTDSTTPTKQDPVK